MEVTNKPLFDVNNIKSFIQNVILSIELSFYKTLLKENNKDLLASYSSLTTLPHGHKHLEDYFINIIKNIQDENIDENIYCLIQSTVINNKKSTENREKHIEDVNIVNIIANLSSHLYQKVPRSKLNSSNEEELIASINDIFKLMNKYFDHIIKEQTDQILVKHYSHIVIESK